MTQRTYKLVKVVLRDDNDNGYVRTTIGYFKSKRTAMAFAHDDHNTDMWKTEYKKVMAIITMSIELETWTEDDMENCEVIWLYD